MGGIASGVYGQVLQCNNWQCATARLDPIACARLRVGGDFVIVERNTRVVFDVALGLGE